MAHIEEHRRRGGVVWRARYRAPDGAERSRTFARRSDAEAFLTKVEDSKLRGEWVDLSLGKTDVREYAEQWLTTKADVALRTFVNIEARLRMHVVPHFGSMPLNRVRPSHVPSWPISSAPPTRRAPSRPRTRSWPRSSLRPLSTVS
jgi:hypothetical protein